MTKDICSVSPSCLSTTNCQEKKKFKALLPITNFTFNVSSPNRELHRYSKESEILNFEIKKKKAKSSFFWLSLEVRDYDDGVFEACLGCTGRLYLKNKQARHGGSLLLGQEDCFKFKSNLCCLVSFRPGWATGWNLASNK